MVIRDLLIKGTETLKEAGIDTARLDAEVLLAHILQKERIYLLFSRKEAVPEAEEHAFLRLVARRAKHEPVAYLVGHREFMSLDFDVCPGVLIPRPDTETLVEFVIDAMQERENPQILDLCTGSGAIAVSLAHYIKGSHLTAYDISDVCVKCAAKNAEKNGVSDRMTVVKQDVLAPLPVGEYDAIVSNPPYIPAETVKGLMAEVHDFEPHSALDGGEGGLVFYRHICTIAQNHLKKGGLLAFEVGHDQKDVVANLLAQSGCYESIGTKQDLAGIHRVVYGYVK